MKATLKPIYIGCAAIIAVLVISRLSVESQDRTESPRAQLNRSYELLTDEQQGLIGQYGEMDIATAEDMDRGQALLAESYKLMTKGGGSLSAREAADAVVEMNELVSQMSNLRGKMQSLTSSDND